MKSTSKGKRSSQSASPMLNKHPENSSSSTGPRKEAGDSAMSSVHLPGADQFDVTNKRKSRRKTKIRKVNTYADSEVSDKTVCDNCTQPTTLNYSALSLFTTFSCLENFLTFININAEKALELLF